MTKSEYEVLKAIRLRTPLIGKTGRLKRHDKAIADLKFFGVIYKDENNILQITPSIRPQYCITRGENAFTSASTMEYFAGMTANDIHLPVWSRNIKDALTFQDFGHAEAYYNKHHLDGVINRIYKGKK